MEQVVATNATPDLVVERAKMPGHYLRRAISLTAHGRIVFLPVVLQNDQWKLKAGCLHLKPDKPLNVIARL